MYLIRSDTMLVSIRALPCADENMCVRALSLSVSFLSCAPSLLSPLSPPLSLTHMMQTLSLTFSVSLSLSLSLSFRMRHGVTMT